MNMEASLCSREILIGDRRFTVDQVYLSYCAHAIFEKFHLVENFKFAYFPSWRRILVGVFKL